MLFGVEYVRKTIASQIDDICAELTNCGELEGKKITVCKRSSRKIRVYGHSRRSDPVFHGSGSFLTRIKTDKFIWCQVQFSFKMDNTGKIQVTNYKLYPDRIL